MDGGTASSQERRDALRDNSLSIADLMFLTAGASAGMWQVTVASQDLEFLAPDVLLNWRNGVFLFYATLSGITMAAALRMLLHFWRTRQAWTPGAVALFAIGALSWLFLPTATSGFVLIAEMYEPGAFNLSLFHAYDAGAFSLAGFFSLWPIVALALLGACAMSGSAGNWLLLRGWWADWLGMWSLVAWGAPAASLIYRVIHWNIDPSEGP